MADDLWRHLREMGDTFTPATIEATRQLFAPLALRPDAVGARVARDMAYGDDARHRLDVFHVPGHADRPVVMFVHGGGFAGGDKGTPEAPFYNNVGAWAVRSGFVGVTMTYRHAPVHAWPAGAQDVRDAVGWLQREVARFGGDPQRIVLVGQSAGGAHVSGYLAGHGDRAAGAPPVAGAVLISGIYEPDAFAVNPMQEVYFGADRSAYAARSSVLALAASAVPCLFTISQFDPAVFHGQLAAVFAARTAMTGRCPEVLYLHGHNHVSPAMQLGSVVDTLGDVLASHVWRMAATSAAT